MTLRWQRLTARQRLTTAVALIPVGTAVIMGATVYLFMRFVPAYDLPTSQSVSTGPISVLNTGTPGGGVTTVTNSAVVTIRGENDVLSTILWISVISAILLGIAGLLIGRILAKRMLRPLHQFNDAANQAAAGGLDHRVALTGPKDEFTDLSDTFDRMLERLDRTFKSHQRFAADASHELRTPLSAMKTMLDVAERDPDTDLSLLLPRLQQTNQRSINTVEALLDLADLDHAVIEMNPVQFDATVQEVIDSSSPELALTALTLNAELTPATVLGNETLLRQLTTNLIQNAIRHNKPGGTIGVTLSSNNERVLLTVTNSGTRIDPASIPALMTPFHRGAGRISDTNPATRSSGLGLSVVAAIAAAHHATVQLAANSDHGLTVSLTFPSAGR